jgi:hypothetical protein
MADTDVIPPVEADVDMKDEPGPGGDAEVKNVLKKNCKKAHLEKSAIDSGLFF